MSRSRRPLASSALALVVWAAGCTTIVNPDPGRLNGTRFDDDAGPGFVRDGGSDGAVITPRDAGPVITLDAGPVTGEETCNGVDDDDDGAIDDGLVAPGCSLTAGVCAGSFATCGGTAGWLACTAASYGAMYQTDETTCDGLDNDCDGTEDEGCACSPGEMRECGSDIGECRLGVQRCVDGAFGDCEGATPSMTEVCDGLDNDCSGTPDDGLTRPACARTLGVCAGSRATCGGTAGWRTCGAAEYGSNYQASETRCDGLDNDCDGMVDEGCATGCSFPGSTCGASQVCACPGLAETCASGGTCVDVFGTYAIRITNVTFPSRDPMGECWDADCSAPDPFVDIGRNSTKLGSTSTHDNVYTTSWPTEVVTTTLNNTDVVNFDVYDEDVFLHDVGLACDVTVSASVLQNRSISCTGSNGVTMSASFIPSR